MIDFINNICRYIFINTSTVYIFSRSINLSKSNKNFIYYFSAIVFSIFIAFLYTLLIEKLDSLFTLIILCIMLVIENSILTNKKIYYSLIVTLLSIAINLSIYVISIFIASMIIKIPLIFEMPMYELSDSHPLFFLLTIIIAITIIYKLFSIKRFKNGFAFLSNESTIDSICHITVLFSGIILIIYSLLGTHMILYYHKHLIIGLLLTATRYNSVD